MKFFIFPILFLSLVFSSCKKDKLLTDSTAKLAFSQDSVLFDTIFTTVGSTTKYFRVYNPNNQKVVISNIRLARGESSPYRFNADGLMGKSVSEVEIDANDSIYVFVEVTVDPNNANNPLVMRDSLLFELNGNVQDVDLEAWGQDAYFHLPDNKIVFLNGGVLYYGTEPCPNTWLADKPHVVYGYAVVDSACTLTIDPGVRVYFHNNAGIWVYRYGTLKVNGTYSQPVKFQGDRLEPEYQDIPGQWDRIWINEGSVNNEINYAIIKNGFIGVQHDLLLGDISEPRKLVMNNCKIENMSGWGIFAYHGNIEGYNNVVSSCGRSVCSFLLGGSYVFNHCTFANYFDAEDRTDPILFLNNHQETTLVPLDNCYFGNCIFEGSNPQELGFDTLAVNNAFNLTFDHCLIKTEYPTNNIHYQNCLINQNPAFVNPEGYDFKLNSNSAAINFGKATIGASFPLDIDNKPRNVDTAPDVGAYEFQP